jgi:hypothetical protein
MSLSVPGTLKILVIGAEGLDHALATPGAAQQQPYYVVECGRQRSRSKPCTDSATAPVWNTAHKFELGDETAAVAVIKDEASRAVLGEALIDLSRCVAGGCTSGAPSWRQLRGAARPSVAGCGVARPSKVGAGAGASSQRDVAPPPSPATGRA